MTRCTTAAHLRLWLQRQPVPRWAEKELVHRLSVERPSTIDACVNSNGQTTLKGFREMLVWGNRKDQVDATLQEIRKTMKRDRAGLEVAIRSMFEGEQTRREGDLQKWLRHLRKPDPEEVSRQWMCCACCQVFERKPRRKCPECGTRSRGPK